MGLESERREGYGAIYCARNPSSSQMSDLGTPSPVANRVPSGCRLNPGEVCGRRDGQRNGLVSLPLSATSHERYHPAAVMKAANGIECGAVPGKAVHIGCIDSKLADLPAVRRDQIQAGARLLAKSHPIAGGGPGTFPAANARSGDVFHKHSGVPPPKGALANSHFSPRCRRYAIQVPSGDQEGMCWSEVAGSRGTGRPPATGEIQIPCCRL